MTIGFCRIDLYLPESASLKQKRSILKSLITRLRNKFNVSVSELEENDLWQKSLIGVVTVSNSSRHADQVLAQVVAMVEREDRVIVTDYSLELL